MFLELKTPQGFRSELIELDEEIVLTPPPDDGHEAAFSLLSRHFTDKAAIDLDLSGDKGLTTPHGRFIPDGTVSPVGHFKDAEPWSSAEGVLLVFEITGTDPRRDREPKRLGYAAADVPCYLLVDRSEKWVTLFTSPENGDYSVLTKVEFGGSIDLPAPFSFTLDTAPLR